MTKIHKINSILVAVLAAIFYKLFMFLKHDPALSKIIPFGDDPYDAVGSFAMIICTMLAVLSLGRAFWPRRRPLLSSEMQLYLVRTQMCAILAVLITLVADVVALVRHPAMWAAAPERLKLLALLGGMAVIAMVGGLWIRHSAKDIPAAKAPVRWTGAALVSLVGILILAVYPERLIEGTGTHLLTIVLAVVVLFSAMRSLVTALIPYAPIKDLQEAAFENLVRGRGRRWGIVLLFGVLLGLFLFAGEMGEGAGNSSLAQTAFVAAIFVGLTVAGMAVAYAFLGQPLGLVRRSTALKSS